MSPRLTSLCNMRLSALYNNVCSVASSVSSLSAIVAKARYYVCSSALVKGTRFRFVHQVYSLFVNLVVRGIELSYMLY